MRLLILLFALSCSTLLSAQCVIEAEITAAYCNPDGEGYFLEFIVDGDGGSFWEAPSINMFGSYDTQEVFVAGPLFNTPFGSLFIRDSLNQECFTLVDIPALDCDDPCFAFEIFYEQEQFGCNNEEDPLFFIGYNSISAPVTVEVFNDNNPEFFSQTFIDRNGGLDLFIPRDEVMILRVTNEGGCVLDTVLVPTVADCGIVSGRTWVDANVNGLRDVEETEFVPGTVELISSPSGAVVASTAITEDGFYLFENVEPWRNYALRVIEDDQDLELTAPNVGDDDTIDSDFFPGDNNTVTFVLQSGESVAYDAGFINTSCPGLEVTTFLDGANAPCGEQVQVITVESETFPVSIVAFDPSNDLVYEQEVIENGDYLLEGIEPGSYLVQVTASDGCTTFLSFELPGLSGALDVTIVRQGSVCSSEGLLLIAEVANADFNELSFLWNTQETTQAIEAFENNALYTVSVISSTGCTGEARFFVEQQSFDTIQVAPVTAIPCGSDEVEIRVEDPQDGIEYTWFGPLNQMLEGAAVTVSMPGFYTVRSSDASSDCFGSGFTQVIDPNIDDIQLIQVNSDSLSCGEQNCIRIVGLDESVIELAEISWDGPPEFDEWNQNQNISWISICTPYPGVYTATVTTECGTTTASYEVGSQSCSLLSGTLYLDSDGDCDLDEEDTPAPGFVLTLTNDLTGDMYYAWTGEDGTWAIELPEGTYTIEPIIEEGQPLETCDPATNVTLGAEAVSGIDVFMPVLFNCPVLTTEITLPFLRRCFQGCAYVHYENTGTATGEDAQVVVVLDPFFTDVIPSVDPVSVEGNVYTFNVGDLPPFSGGTIGFIFTISCEAELGQSHCIDAAITPDDSCHDDPAWNGALVEIISAECLGDSVVFTVSNVGDNQMSIPLNYIIVEDGIMLSEEPITNGQLIPGEAYTITMEANGSTYAVITNQEPNAPGTDQPTAVFEGCNGNGNSFSTGFANLLPLDSGNPARSTVCRENVGSYDPNDKMGYPLGWDGGNIEEGTRLDYEIRFQNTGTDTAFTVVISDTLSADLDLATFKMEAASHPYTISIDTHRVITWTFDNILLPDSSTNLLLSQGAVVFSIDHDESLIPGDEITNEAAIYFDFNEPIITNVSKHIIAKEGLPVGLRAIQAQSIDLSVYPNPASDFIKVKVPADELQATDVLQVTDLHGRPLLRTTYGQLGRGLDVSELPAGYYLLLVNDAAGIVKGRAAFVVTAP